MFIEKTTISHDLHYLCVCISVDSIYIGKEMLVWRDGPSEKYFCINSLLHDTFFINSPDRCLYCCVYCYIRQLLLILHAAFVALIGIVHLLSRNNVF